MYVCTVYTIDEVAKYETEKSLNEVHAYPHRFLLVLYSV